MSARLTTKRGQTFCLYCQKNYETPFQLARHIRRVHKGTYAEYNVVRKVK